MSQQGYLSFKNKHILIKYENCSCYFCFKTFKTSEINEYVDEEKTALCPHCGIDSVVCFEDSSLPTTKCLKEWHKESFSPFGITPYEIQKNKDRVHKLTLLECAKIYSLKNNRKLFFYLKDIPISTLEKGEIEGCLLYDIDNKKQVTFEKKMFLESLCEISIEEKKKFYHKLSSRWNYRLVYSVNELRLAVHECYYPKISFTENPAEAQIYIKETNPEKLKDNLMEILEWMLNAFAQPIVFDESENQNLSTKDEPKEKNE